MHGLTPTYRRTSARRDLAVARLPRRWLTHLYRGRVETPTTIIVGGTSGIGLRLAETYAARGRGGRDHGPRSRSATTAAAGCDPVRRAVSARAPSISRRPSRSQRRSTASDRSKRLVLERGRARRERGRDLRHGTGPAARHAQARGLYRGGPRAPPRLTPDASILLFGGLAMRRPYPGSTTVSTVNGGVTGLVHTLAVELAPISRQRRSIPASSATAPTGRTSRPASSTATIARTPLGRLATMDEIVDAADLPARERRRQRRQPRCRRRMAARHQDRCTVLIRREDIVLAPARPEHSSGLTVARLIGGHTGSTHTGLLLVELTRRLGRLSRALVRDDVLRPRGRADAVPRRPRDAAPARRVRRDPGRRSSTPGGRGDAARWIEMCSPRPRGAEEPPDTFFLGTGARERADAARRPRPAQPQLLPTRRGRHGPRPPQARRAGGGADGLGQHGDGCPRLQRDHGEDARRQATRRPAPDDVHGRLPARRGRPSARPSVRGVVLHARGRGRGGRRRRALHAAAGRRASGRGSAASTRSTRPRGTPCSGWRRPLPGRPTATPTGSSATGSISPRACRATTAAV